MEHKQAAEILMRVVERYPLSAEEREAVNAALGVLSWTSLAQSRIKSLKAKRDKGLHN